MSELTTADTKKASEWLRKEYESAHGEKKKWNKRTLDNYHRDFGLILHFIIDTKEGNS